MRIDQLIVGAGRGDAITNEALVLRQRLRMQGESELFSVHIDPGLEGEVRRLDEYREPPRAERAALVVHASIGEAQVHDFLARTRCPLVVRYHNITPPEYFQPWDAAVATQLLRGRAEVAGLRDRCVAALCDSRFNAEDLETLGYADPEVFPVVVPLDRLRSVEPRPTARFPGAPDDGRPVVLFVGRLAANKAQSELIAAFHVLKTYLVPDARLCLVGGETLPTYVRALRRYVSDLALPDVTFTGPINDAELAWMYRNSSVFACLSRHEGFCVPLVEAMSLDLPVVARDASAVGETASGAALLLGSDRATDVAEALATVITEPSVREALVAAGRARVSELEPDRAATRLADRIVKAVS